jgi:hypothetical protein
VRGGGHERGQRWLDVVPAIGAAATSTASAPARPPPASVPSCPPAVSWVCTCTGRSKRSRRARTSVAAAGAQQPGHVLDRQDVRAGVHDLLGQPQVVVEGVQPLAGSDRVAGVAERDLRHRRPVARTASIAGRICSTSLSASKIRKTSTPVAAASATNASVTRSGYGVYPTVFRPRSSICRQTFGSARQARRAAPRGPRRGSAAPTS